MAVKSALLLGAIASSLQVANAQALNTADGKDRLEADPATYASACFQSDQTFYLSKPNEKPVPPCAAEQGISLYCEQLTDIRNDSRSGADRESRRKAYKDCMLGEGSSFKSDLQACVECKLEHNSLSGPQADFLHSRYARALRDFENADAPEGTFWTTFAEDFFDRETYASLEQPIGPVVTEEIPFDSYYPEPPKIQGLGKFTIDGKEYPAVIVNGENSLDSKPSVKPASADSPARDPETTGTLSATSAPEVTEVQSSTSGALEGTATSASPNEVPSASGALELTATPDVPNQPQSSTSALEGTAAAAVPDKTLSASGAPDATATAATQDKTLSVSGAVGATATAAAAQSETLSASGALSGAATPAALNKTLSASGTLSRTAIPLTTGRPFVPNHDQNSTGHGAAALTEEERKALENSMNTNRFDLDHGRVAIHNMSAKAAQFSWRIVFELDVLTGSSHFHFEMCQREEQNLIITKVLETYVVGLALSYTYVNGVVELICDTGSLHKVKVEQGKVESKPLDAQPEDNKGMGANVADFKPAGMDLAVAECQSVDSCVPKACSAEQCGATKLIIQIKHTIVVQKFVECAEKCNVIQTCVKGVKADKCEEKPVPTPQIAAGPVASPGEHGAAKVGPHGKPVAPGGSKHAIAPPKMGTGTIPAGNKAGPTGQGSAKPTAVPRPPQNPASGSGGNGPSQVVSGSGRLAVGGCALMGALMLALF